MTSLLTLSDDIRQNETFKNKNDIRQNETFKEKSGIFARIFTKQWIKIYFFSQQDADHVAGDRARTSMSRIASRASSLINSFIFVHCHKQRIVSVYEDRNVH